MAKKQAPIEAENENYTADDTSDTSALNSLDFNIQDEYVPDPILPNGTYHGAVTKVTFNPAKSTINWSICLHDNGGFLSDNTTSIDGSYTYYTNLLPVSGDENSMIKSGKQTKRQWKINALAEFCEKLGIDMSTPKKILEALEEQIWVGMEVTVDTEIQEYNGSVSSRVKLGGIRKSTQF